MFAITSPFGAPVVTSRTVASIVSAAPRQLMLPVLAVPSWMAVIAIVAGPTVGHSIPTMIKSVPPPGMVMTATSAITRHKW